MPEVIETIDQAELSEKLKEFMQAHRIHLTAGQQRYLHIKRATDAVLSGLALLVLLIPLGLVVILQKLSSPHEPAIFRQQRVGRGGKLFTMYKFRTMKTSAPQYASTKEFADAEQYISKLGHILRSTSIDELPQLYNVLRGDMSLIGPRPLIPQEERSPLPARLLRRRPAAPRHHRLGASQRPRPAGRLRQGLLRPRIPQTRQCRLRHQSILVERAEGAGAV